MIRRHFFLIAAIIVVLIMGAAAAYKLTVGKSGGQGGAPMAGPPGGKAGPGGPGRGGRGGGGTTVTAVAVEPRVFADRLQVLGVAKGRESVTLTSNSSEIIESVRFRPGDRVQRGQVLVELRRDEEDAGILQAESDLSLAKLNADRWTELANRGIAPRQQAEQFQAAYERAKAALTAAESRRGDRLIRAPFSGVVGLTDIAPGALISPGTAIATLDDISVIRVDFDVPDRYLSLIREGGTIVATTDAYPDERYTGRIVRLDTRVDERTRSLKVRAEFPNPGGRLKPGMLMRVGVDRGTRVAIGAPESAVQFTGGQAYVYKIGTRADGLYAQQTPVITGSADCGYIEIREGLETGERIIADGLNRIQPNQTVAVVAGAGAEQARGNGAGPGGPVAKANSQPQAKSGQAQSGQTKSGQVPALALIEAQSGCSPSASAAVAPPAAAQPASRVAASGPAGPGAPGRVEAAAK